MQKGFTLIETLVTLSLLAIVLAVALPNLSSARIQGTQQAARQYGQNVQLVLNAFLSNSPSLTAATLLADSSWKAPTSNPNLTLSGAVDCSSGYGLSGGTNFTIYTPVADTTRTFAWKKAPSKIKCLMAPGSLNGMSSEFSLLIYTWFDGDPGTYYLNGETP